jgi:hypothetical protein
MNMRHATRIATQIGLSAALLAACLPARADVVADWNETAIAAGVKSRQPPFVHTRSVAIVHLALFEAINSIERRYTPYRMQIPAQPDASREAAAAAAAHFALARLYPEQTKELETAYQSSLAAVPDGAAKADGMRVGQQAAEAILASRAKDGHDAPNSWRPITKAGVYVPTAPAAGAMWGRVEPFGLKSAAQFRPPSPIRLRSTQWAKEYNEIKSMGSKSSASRTTEQTDIVRVWELTGPPFVNQVARQVAATKAFDLLDNARLFALFSMAVADSYISVFDAKYTYNFWRPVTAIRNGDIDDNDATERDATWESAVTTPMHPEYPCAHCINTAAGAAVLEAFFGDAVPTFSVANPAAAGVSRKFAKLSSLVAESIDARVYCGVHYRFSGEVGAAMGRKIGEYIVRHQLKPID